MIILYYTLFHSKCERSRIYKSELWAFSVRAKNTRSSSAQAQFRATCSDI